MFKVTENIVFGKRRMVQTQAASLKRAEGSEERIYTSYIERVIFKEVSHASDFIDAHDKFRKAL